MSTTGYNLTTHACMGHRLTLPAGYFETLKIIELPIAKRHPLQVRKRFEQLQTGDVGMSFITHGELMFGAEKSQYRNKTIEKLSRLIEIIHVVSPDDQMAQHYGEIRAVLERSGQPIGANDLWIAAHARSLGITLVSNNIKEFEPVPKLKLENWL